MHPRESTRSRPRYRFGDYALDPAARELRKGDRTIALAPKMFDCLAYLIAHRDRAVGHDELGAAVWGRADVTNAQLWQLMYKLRRALGNDGDATHLIRTIPHFGFHWVAPTETEDGATTSAEITDVMPAAGAAPVPSDERPKRLSSWRRYAVAATFAAVLVATVIGLSSMRAPIDDEAPFAAAVNAIGVLPADIVDPADTADSDWMRLGLMDFVVGRLRKAQVAVIASSDIVALSRSTASADLPARVRHATGANRLVTASAIRQQEGWQVRLSFGDGNGAPRVVSGYSPDALLAAGEAADHLLGLLGHSPPEATSAPASTAQLFQRIEAALLVDDAGTARRLIDAATPAVRALPVMELYLAQAESAVDERTEARQRLERLLPTVSAEADPLLRGRALTSLGVLRRPDLDASLAAFSEAITLLTDESDTASLGRAYLGRGITHALRDDNRSARPDLARARVLFTLTNDSLQLARVDNSEAGLDSAVGRAATALPLFERATETLERFGATNKLVIPVVNQILANLQLLQPAQAAAVYERMRPKLDGADSKAALRLLDHVGAVSLAATGRLSEARSVLASLPEDGAPDVPVMHALADGLLAEIDLAHGRLDEATARSTRSIETLSARRRFHDDQAQAWLTLTRALRLAGDTDAVREQTNRFTQWAAPIPDLPVTLRVRLAEAEQLWAAGEHDAAIDRYEATLTVVETEGTPLDLRIVVESYVGALIDAGRLDEASAAAGRLARWVASDFETSLVQVRLYQALGQAVAWRTALAQARALAGERPIPLPLQVATAAGGLAQGAP